MGGTQVAEEALKGGTVLMGSGTVLAGGEGRLVSRCGESLKGWGLGPISLQQCPHTVA